MNCRFCHATLEHVFLDLGSAPPSNAFLTEADLHAPETYYPLRLFVCEQCWLVQTEDYAGAAELFHSEYPYFSSVSQGWLKHASQYSAMICERLGLGSASRVVEVASNDGYLLRNFLARGIPCLGIEPTASTAAAAEALGIPVLGEFFGAELAARLAEEGKRADLLIGNNVYAHVPNINDFTDGLKIALQPGGTITLEFPHLLRLIEHGQFDTVYHEHFSYLSLTTVSRIFARAGLRVWDVDELTTHGGSLRIYGCHAEDRRDESPRVADLLSLEKRRGLRQLATYADFQARADRIKDDLLGFLIEQKRAGNFVVAYGAAAKGNTLLNYAGIKSDLLFYVCDAALSKQGKFLPGSHIPILSPEILAKDRPDCVLILPWNLKDEIAQLLQYLREQGCMLVTGVPRLEIV